MARRLRIGDVLSTAVAAVRGITAGSGFATFEMRLVLIRVIDNGLEVFPEVAPTVYVDDMSVEHSHSDEEIVVHQVAGFGRAVCSQLHALQMEVSGTKSVCTASSPKLGRRIEQGMDLELGTIRM